MHFSFPSSNSRRFARLLPLLLFIALAGCRGTEVAAPPTTTPTPLTVKVDSRPNAAEAGRLAEEVGTDGDREIHFVDSRTGEFYSFYRESMVHKRTDRDLPTIFQIYPDEIVSAENLTGKKILDLGCGNGAFVKGLRGEGYDAYGIDLFLEDSSVDPPYLTRQDLTKLDFESSTFDCVFCTYVLIKREEVDQDFFVKGLTEALRVTKPGGEIYLCPVALSEAEVAELMRPFDGRVKYSTPYVRERYEDLRVLVVERGN